jgi:hypothetical protein
MWVHARRNVQRELSPSTKASAFLACHHVRLAQLQGISVIAASEDLCTLIISARPIVMLEHSLLMVVVWSAAVDVQPVLVLPLVVLLVQLDSTCSREAVTLNALLQLSMVNVLITVLMVSIWMATYANLVHQSVRLVGAQQQTVPDVLMGIKVMMESACSYAQQTL